MPIKKTWKYDYADRCECSDDDNCGCTFPNNMGRSFTSSTEGQIRSVYEYNHVRVGEAALNFTAPAVFADGSTSNDFNFFDYIADSNALLMFYRADFSAICPREISAINQAYDEFLKRGIKLVAISVDPLPAHVTWRKLPLAEGGVGAVQFPLVSDVNKAAGLAYGVMRADGMAQRASFLIDRNFIIRYSAVYDKNISRNVTETLRVIDTLLELERTSCKGLECWMRQKDNLDDELHTQID